MAVLEATGRVTYAEESGNGGNYREDIPHAERSGTLTAGGEGGNNGTDGQFFRIVNGLGELAVPITAGGELEG